MSKFYVFIEGSEGCDYSIGCGKRLIKLDGQTKEAALKEVFTLLFGVRDESGDFEESGYDIRESRTFDGRWIYGELNKAQLFEVSGVEDVLKDMRGAYDLIEERKKLKAKEQEEEQNLARELYEYNRLKEKFGDKQYV